MSQTPGPLAEDDDSAAAYADPATADPQAGPAAEPSIRSQATRGLRWGVIGILATKIGSFAMALVMARLLVPQDFGLFAVALAATQFLMHVNDLGVIAATTQWRGKIEEMAPTATVVAITFSCVAYGLFFVFAPDLARLSGDGDAAGVIRVLTAIVVVDGITAVRSGVLMRNFQQDRLMIANVFGFALNAILAIALAANGAGAYSFAVGQLTGNILTGILVWHFARVPLRIGVDKAILRRLTRFGAPLAVSLGIDAILMNIDYAIVGHVVGPAALGFYLLAFNISSWAPGVITTAVRYVSVGAFARLSESKERFNNGVRLTVPLLFGFILPIAILLGVLARPLVGGLYGERWLPAAAILEFLVVLMVVRMMVAFVTEILIGVGDTRMSLWINLVWVVALVPALFVGTHLDGAQGTAVAHGIVALAVAVPISLYGLHRNGVGLRPIGRAMVRPLLAGVVAAAAVLGARSVVGTNVYVQLVVAGSVGVLVYVLVAVPLPILRDWRGVLREARGPAPAVTTPDRPGAQAQEPVTQPNALA